MNPWKRRLANAFDRSGLNRVLLSARRRLQPVHIRAVNYHEVPRRAARDFAAQLAFYREHFAPVGLDELDACLAGEWRSNRPGLLISFDDGLRSHAEIVAPLLEEYGFPGWFCVPAGFPDLDDSDPETFRRMHRVEYDESDYDDGRGVLSWDEVRRLDRNHVIVSHSFTHRRLGDDLDAATRQHEVVAAKARLEAQLGHPVRVFAWVGGEEWSYGAASAEAIRRAGYDFALMTNNAVIVPSSDPHQLQRTNVEASDPPEVVRFALSGALDLLYWPKRRRVNRKTAAGPGPGVASGPAGDPASQD